MQELYMVLLCTNEFLLVLFLWDSLGPGSKHLIHNLWGKIPNYSVTFSTGSDFLK